jgi:hypothetical protein
VEVSSAKPSKRVRSDSKKGSEEEMSEEEENNIQNEMDMEGEEG